MQDQRTEQERQAHFLYAVGDNVDLVQSLIISIETHKEALEFLYEQETDEVQKQKILTDLQEIPKRAKWLLDLFGIGENKMWQTCPEEFEEEFYVNYLNKMYEK